MRKRSRKISAVFFLMLFVHSLFAPYYAFALTSGPHQPEFTSYEDASATDMVNLLTGDFNFNLPILEIPGSEGSFSLPLSYHAGIGLEQESSWVGLGFNINAGSIVRDVNQYPDDASGEAHDVSVQDLTGVRGWSSSLLGLGQIGWNSQVGNYGAISLLNVVNYTYDDRGMSSVGLIGFSVGRKGGFNAEQFVLGVYTIATYGAGAAESSAVSIASSVAKQAAIDLAIGAAMSAFTSSSSGTTNASTTGFWEYNKNRSKQRFLHKNYWVWLDKTRSENMYGTLYSGKTRLASLGTVGYAGGPHDPSFFLVNNSALQNINFYEKYDTEGTASDINFTVDGSIPYKTQNTPTTLANDDYTVNAPGISGSIQPFRLEAGSVCMPRDMTPDYSRFALLPYLDYKVPFIYEGYASNRYFHVGGGAAVPTQPQFYYGLDITRIPCSPTLPCELQSPSYTHQLFDRIFKEDQRISSDFAEIKKVPQGNNIDWQSNQEIVTDLSTKQTPPNKFIDFLSGAVPAGYENLPDGYKQSDRYKFRMSTNLNSKTTPNLGIGGYSITATDGTTYHFALPVYDYEEFSESINVNDDGQNSSVKRDAPFANTWLLTAITGPDFIDRNTNGLADDGDWGYWVKMNYGKHSDVFDWRMPYEQESTIVDADGKYKSYTQGKKQLYYLNSIETRSHVALFMKSSREDGESASTTATVVPLKLDEICLMQKEHYNKLLGAPYNIGTYSNTISTICSSAQYTGAAIRDYINKNCVKRVVFNYSYDLCENTPNAGGPNNAKKGKLTLTGISVRGRNDLSAVPDYKFEYAQNPKYDVNDWDGWGMYNPSGSPASTSHTTSDPTGANGAAWSLTRIGTPLGSDIIINYERDTYSSISGEAMLDPKTTFGNTNYNVYYPGGGINQNGDTYNKITLGSTAGLVVGDRVRLVGEIRFKCSGNPTYTTKSYSGDYSITAVAGNTITVNGDFLGVSVCGTSGTAILVDYNNGSLYKVISNKPGGNIRVRSIVTRDEFGRENKLRYLYNKDDGTSSGVVAQEPDYIKNTDYSFYSYLNYPRTPVIYGRVSALSGSLSTDADYHTKQVFEFQTPDKTLYTLTDQDMGPVADDYATIQRHFYKIEDRTSRIGKLVSVKVYDKTSLDPITQSTLNYGEDIVSDNGDHYQGVFMQSVLFADDSENKYFKSNRTTSMNYPYLLKEVINSKDGFSSSTQNLTWDLLTGAVTRKLDKSSLGVYTKTVTKPAYKVPEYAELGSKALDVNKKNMLLQNAAVYTYLSDASANELGLIGAEAQTWRKDWEKYRVYNGQTYVNEDAQASPVWRKGPLFVWRGDYSRLRSDGTHTFSDADKFAFGGTNSLWKNMGEHTRFDHYGMPLESMDMNGIYSATKMGYDNRAVIATASNASYNEIAFSSAEDRMPDPNEPYFGGEVGLGLGHQVNAPVHTGNTALSLTNGYGFVFKTTGLNSSRQYRVSVWANSVDGKIYYKLSDGSIVVPAGQTKSKAVAITDMGDWYRLDLTIDNKIVNPATIAEVGVTASGQAIVYDDFRFQPYQSSMTCYVYPPLGFEFNSAARSYSSFSCVLDNDNLFTKYETNAKGEQIKVYRESISYGERQILESKLNYKGFNK